MGFNVAYPELFYEYLLLLFIYILEHTTKFAHTYVLFIMAIFSISDPTVITIMK